MSCAAAVDWWSKAESSVKCTSSAAHNLGDGQKVEAELLRLLATRAVDDPVLTPRNTKEQKRTALCLSLAIRLSDTVPH